VNSRKGVHGLRDEMCPLTNIFIVASVAVLQTAAAQYSEHGA
jgi:hypothetical protein